MTALERLKALATSMSRKQIEQYLTVIYLGFQLLLMFINPVASMAMGIFLIALLLAATSF